MATEQSFMKSVFYGVIPEELIFPYPEAGKEERENTSMILDSVRRYFAANVDAAKIDREHAIPPEVMDGLKALGLFGLQIPTDHDGIGLSATAYARVMQEVGGLDGSIAVTLGAQPRGVALEIAPVRGERVGREPALDAQPRGVLVE